ncbi:hypothetical protein BESB_009450 [Besnoitia besnoiti]|uniref:Peptidase family T4 protein n=1 Tax=Besnoitia besnoiti TaxID=94643 RepID=A0A2A9MQM1_BESBE|nr:hypothetical protein BESB_009450 [Besnoitia besnoiti]PFH38603.1 hypothetical protein BESB_009450 [Besnoitia besnoiti]
MWEGSGVAFLCHVEKRPSEDLSELRGSASSHEVSPVEREKRRRRAEGKDHEQQPTNRDCRGFPTGASFFCFERPLVAAGRLFGAAPASRDFEVLQPGNSVQHIHGFLFGGGSVFGLGAVGGLLEFQRKRGVGLPTSAGPIPVCPALGIFDLPPSPPAVPPFPLPLFVTSEDVAAACDAAASVLAATASFATPAEAEHGHQQRRKQAATKKRKLTPTCLPPRVRCFLEPRNPNFAAASPQPCRDPPTVACVISDSPLLPSAFSPPSPSAPPSHASQSSSLASSCPSSSCCGTSPSLALPQRVLESLALSSAASHEPSQTSASPFRSPRQRPRRGWAGAVGAGVGATCGKVAAGGGFSGRQGGWGEAYRERRWRARLREQEPEATGDGRERRGGGGEEEHGARETRETGEGRHKVAAAGEGEPTPPGTKGAPPETLLRVQAFVVVNSFGDVVQGSARSKDGSIALGLQKDGILHSTAELLEEADQELLSTPIQQRNTTLVAVFTNLALERAALSRVSTMAAAGMARAIRPAFSSVDGDAVLVISTGELDVGSTDETTSEIIVGSMAAECVTDAIRQAAGAFLPADLPVKADLTRMTFSVRQSDFFGLTLGDGGSRICQLLY